MSVGRWHFLHTLFTFFFAQKQKKTWKKNRILVVEKVNLKCCSYCCCCWGNSRARFSVVSQRYFDEFRGLLKGAEAKNTKKHTSSGSDGDNIRTRRNTKTLCSAVSESSPLLLAAAKSMCCGEVGTTTTSLCECVSDFALLSL